MFWLSLENGGSGKTRFVEMLKDKLEQEKKYDAVCFFDAWKNDLYNEPIKPLFKAMAKDLFYKTIQREAPIAQSTTMLDGIEGGVKNAAKADVVGMISELYNGIVNCIGYDEKKYVESLSSGETVDAMENLHSKLSEAIGTNHFLVIIDELDRCKPQFTLRLLEAVKHLFNIKGITYVFSLDISQLRYTINREYGANFDSVRYLERFFDVISYIPKTSMRVFVKETLETVGLNDLADKYKDHMYMMCHDLELSAREIKQVVTQYKILYDELLVNYHSDNAKLLYFYLVAVRYKKPFLFLKTCEKNNKDENGLFDHLILTTNSVTYECMRTLRENPIINDISLTLTKDGKKEYAIEKIRTFEDAQEGTLKNDESYCGVLYAPELTKKDYIGELRLLRYLMFNMEGVRYDDE